MKARKPKDAWFGFLLAPWITVLSLHQCSSWVLLRGITTVIARALRCTWQVCILDHRTDSVFLLWFLLPEPWFHYDGLELLSSCLPWPPWDHAWWCFKRSCCCLSRIRPSFVSMTEASNRWSPAIISKCGVLHMFWRHNWRQEEYQSSGSEAQLEMPPGMSWTKRIFNIKAHRAYRWWNVT